MGCRFTIEHERYLLKALNAPVVIKNYPRDIKAFYMRQNEDGKTVAAMDVVAPGIGEIIGGSQREERLDVLISLEEMGLNKEDYSWYRDLRKYGTVPHSGFGLGFERLVAYVTVWVTYVTLSLSHVQKAARLTKQANNLKAAERLF